MKKTLLSLAVIATALVSITSCGTKDYTCTCTASGDIVKVVIPSATKAQAETICKANETYEQGSTLFYTCELD